MTLLTNTGRRRIGIPVRPALILDGGQSVSVTDEEVNAIRKNRTVERWLESGVLTLSDGPVKVEVDVETHKTFAPQRKPRVPKIAKPDTREVVNLPEGVTGEGVECHHAGGGWWEVYVNGFKVTDRKVRKDESESIASEYD